jgi:hypothetical protein
MDRQASKENAEKLVAKDPLGAIVDVYYDPTNPTKALLEPGVKPSLFLRSVVFLLMSFLILTGQIG